MPAEGVHPSAHVRFSQELASKRANSFPFASTVLPEPKRFSAVEAEVASTNSATNSIETRVERRTAAAPTRDRHGDRVQVVMKRAINNSEHPAQLRQYARILGPRRPSEGSLLRPYKAETTSVRQKDRGPHQGTCEDFPDREAGAPRIPGERRRLSARHPEPGRR